MKRDQIKERFSRLSLKNLDQQFKKEVELGLKCSPFEARVLVDTVKEIYFPALHHPLNLKPGQLVVNAISEDEPAGRPIKDCQFKQVVITLNVGEEDLNIREEQGVEKLRQHRLLRITQEALAQGALLTVEDLAYQIFNLGYSTILRDIASLKKKGIIVPLRSSQKDIGRTISHKERIIRLWLKGKEYDRISRETKHRTESIARYINLFKRTIALREKGFDISSIAYLLRSSQSLIKAYLKLFKKYQKVAFSARIKEIKEFLKKTKKLKGSEVSNW